MGEESRGKFEAVLVIATMVILIINMIAFFGTAGIAILGILNALVFIGYATFIFLDWMG